jgi:CubicO group peptidase (beta-lactamase class C family)
MTKPMAIEAALDRRAILELGAAAGIGAALMPELARAADRPELLSHVRDLIARWVGPGKFPGMVASLGLPGREPEFAARGTQGFLDTAPVTPDSLFRIFSMTKPVTGMATMLLIDEGKLGLDQPLYDILPKFRDMQVQVTPDGSVSDLRPAKNPIRIRNLITHTSGLGYSIIQRGPIKQLLEERGLVVGQISRDFVPGLSRGDAVRSLEKFADGMAEVPLVYEPGTQWSYSLGLDVMGRVIEVVSGMSYDAFLKQRIFEPCGMESTFFQVPGSEKARLTTNYAVADGQLTPIDPGETSLFLDAPPFPSGGVGLVSSPRDYDRFLRMLANFGTIDGRRVMGELAVRTGTSNLLPRGVEGPNLGVPGDFGAGGRVGVGDEQGIFGWSGAAGTLAMVDLIHGLTSGFFVQYMPPDALPLQREYQQALKADLTALMENSP